MPRKPPPKKYRFSSENQPEKNGRPKGSLSSKKLIQKYLNATLGDNEITEFERMIIAQIQKAIDKKDTNAFDKLLDRLEGKSIQNISIIDPPDVVIPDNED